MRHCVYLDDYGARDEDGNISSKHLEFDSKLTRRTVYDHFASKGWNEHLESNSGLKVQHKLKRWGVGGSEALIHGWAKVLRPRVPPQVWDYYFRLVFRSVPFEKRMRDANMKNSRGQEFTNVCYFCGNGEDGAHHVYKYCSVVKEAARRCLGTVATGIEWLLLTDCRIQLKHAREALLFNYAVWRVRQDYLRTLGSTAEPSDIYDRIVARFKNSLEAKKRKRAITEQMSQFLDNPPRRRLSTLRMALPFLILARLERASTDSLGLSWRNRPQFTWATAVIMRRSSMPLVWLCAAFSAPVGSGSAASSRTATMPTGSSNATIVSTPTRDWPWR